MGMGMVGMGMVAVAVVVVRRRGGVGRSLMEML
jgi:hypothetical protein